MVARHLLGPAVDEDAEVVADDVGRAHRRPGPEVPHLDGVAGGREHPATVEEVAIDPADPRLTGPGHGRRVTTCTCRSAPGPSRPRSSVRSPSVTMRAGVCLDPRSDRVSSCVAGSASSVVVSYTVTSMPADPWWATLACPTCQAGSRSSPTPRHRCPTSVAESPRRRRRAAAGGGGRRRPSTRAARRRSRSWPTRLRSFDPVSTSRPAPETFAAAYEAAAAGGATGGRVGAPVGRGVGHVRLGGARGRAGRRARGRRRQPAGRARDRLRGAVGSRGRRAGRPLPTRSPRRPGPGPPRASSYFYVDTLEHLRRGGRIGAAAALLGAALAVKPLLTVADGRVEPLEKVRTAGRALARIEELACQAAGDGPVDVAVQHLGAEDRARRWPTGCGSGCPHAAEVWLREVSAVIGAHVGPGMVAVSVAPRPEPDRSSTVPGRAVVVHSPAADRGPPDSSPPSVRHAQLSPGVDDRDAAAAVARQRLARLADEIAAVQADHGAPATQGRRPLRGDRNRLGRASNRPAGPTVEAVDGTRGGPRTALAPAPAAGGDPPPGRGSGRRPAAAPAAAAAGRARRQRPARGGGRAGRGGAGRGRRLVGAGRPARESTAVAPVAPAWPPSHGAAPRRRRRRPDQDSRATPAPADDCRHAGSRTAAGRGGRRRDRQGTHTGAGHAAGRIPGGRRAGCGRRSPARASTSPR